VKREFAKQLKLKMAAELAAMFVFENLSSKLFWKTRKARRLALRYKK